MHSTYIYHFIPGFLKCDTAGIRGWIILYCRACKGYCGEFRLYPWSLSIKCQWHPVPSTTKVSFFMGRGAKLPRVHKYYSTPKVSTKPPPSCWCGPHILVFDFPSPKLSSSFPSFYNFAFDSADLLQVLHYFLLA